MKYKNINYIAFALTLGLILSVQVLAITKIDMETPPNSIAFGRFVEALPSGNIVVADPEYSVPGGVQRIGAVYLFNGETRQLINTIRGSTANDAIGSGGIKVLENGNYLIISPDWSNGSAQEAGAVTFVFGTLGLSGVVSASNSLVGTKTGDRVGANGVETFGEHHYIVRSLSWGNGSATKAGAITYCRFSLGCRREITSSNSLVGTSTDDLRNAQIIFLANDNFVIQSPRWNTFGAVTFVKKLAGISGEISSANSFIGTSETGPVGSSTGRVKALTNGNYVVLTGWKNSNGDIVGSAVLGSGESGITGTATASNSLVGSSTFDFNSAQITPLPNGNYVINTPDWDKGAILNAGAVTLCNGTTATVGVISAGNSLVGSSFDDRVGTFTTALANSNYVVSSLNWDDGNKTNVGAVTLGNGETGITGEISFVNSLLGSRSGDQVGWNVVGLTNGNYVVSSPFWDRGTIINAGAVTFGNGISGITGFVSTANSLVGSTANDSIGTRDRFGNNFPGVLPLENGNYVVNSSFWNNGEIADAGASTFANGMSGISGTISATNSLVGSSAGDSVGINYQALNNGNYIVGSYLWDNAGKADAGAVTFGNGNSGVNGEIQNSNSLVGSTALDNVGRSVFIFPNGDYGVVVKDWDNGAVVDVGAFTIGNGQTGIAGNITTANSLIGGNSGGFVSANIAILSDDKYVFQTIGAENGSIMNAGSTTYIDSNLGITGQLSNTNSVLGETAEIETNMSYSFDEANNQLVVGRPFDSKVTLVTLNSRKTKFDFDGDSKTDLSIFRPIPAEWWFLRSSDGGNNAFQFGQTNDKLVPADFTGDGKTDVAFWRESTGEWFVMRSEDFSFYSLPFGTPADIPAPGDFDGDGKADIAVFRPSSATWFILRSSDGNTDIIGFGISEDKPVVADYDGDGKDDIAIYRPSNSQWWLNRSNDGVVVYQFGQTGDKTVQGDYTGDGRADVAFWRPASGEWFVIRSEDDSFFSFPFGTGSDIPSPGDYDGDGKADAAVFRPSNTTWYLNNSTSGAQILGFGSSGDIPVPNAYVYE